MEKKGRLQFLGTGSSTGVPVIDCSCKVCRSDDPKNKRLRPGISLASEGKTYLIDAGPDFRQQALSYHIKAPDALFLTHTHYDHIGGLEEFRAYSYHNGMHVPCYLSRFSFECVQKMYYYHFFPKEIGKNQTAAFDFIPLEKDQGEILIDEKIVQYFSYAQGGVPVLGFLFGNLAFVTDIKEYSEDLFLKLQNIDILIISASCLKHSHVQMTVDEAKAFSERVRAKKTYFVHLSHDIEYAYVSSLLPANIELAYDGLEVEFEW